MRDILSTFKKLLLSISLVGGLIYSNCYGEESSTDLCQFKPNQLKKLALQCEMKGDVYTALMYMQVYQQKKNDNPKSIYYLAELYRKSRQYDSAIVYYSNPLIDNDDKFPLRKYHLGSLKMMIEAYEDAKSDFTSFRKTYKGKDSKEYRKLARNYLIGCDSALNKRPVQLTSYADNIGSEVNTDNGEFSPFPLSKNKILYSSLPLDSSNVYSHSNNTAPVRELYVAEKFGQSWRSMGKVEWEMNDPNYNTVNAALSPDGERMYFTRCTKNWKYNTICNIYIMEKFGNTYTAPQKLDANINSENYTSTHPAIGTNQKNGSDILYFVSDRPGGKGGLDIWYAIYDIRSGAFKPAKNLGNTINTFADEITPYYNVPTQTLYYSSNGLPGYGGFDTYRTKGYERKWETSENIGPPVNSSYNDLYLALNADGNSGFFTSNRPGSMLLESTTCCDDIYFFNWKLPQTIPSRGLVFNNSNGEILRNINKRFGENIPILPEGEHLTGVTVMLYRKNEDQKLALVQSVKTKDGYYTFDLERDKDYEIVVKNYGYFETTISVNTRDYLSEDTLILSEIGINYIPEIELAFNVYYATDEYKLTPDDELLIDSTVLFLLDLLPIAIVEIGAHTDNEGKLAYNQKLSQKRAESVVEYLKQKEIEQNRLVAKGYGMSQPIAPNQFPDGTDNPEGRKKNRRTQIKIIGSLVSDELDEE